MALTDLLNSLLATSQGSLGFGQTTNGVAPGQSTAPGGQTATPVSELVVQTQKKPQSGPPPVITPVQNNNQPLNVPIPTYTSPPPTGVDQTPSPVGYDYNNSQQAQAVQSAIGGEPSPQGGTANQGIYGLLPKNLQHGTLRNVLGAIGDAYLVGNHMQPAYEERMQRQQMGNAMAGADPNDPGSMYAAAQRVAATGAIGAPDLADKLMSQAEQAALRRQYMEYNQNYREQIVGEKNQNLIRQAGPQMQYYLSQATSAADYAQRLTYVQGRIKAIDPGLDATAELGVPTADQWQSGMIGNLGMTSNQAQVSSDKGQERETQVKVAKIRQNATVTAAGINANGRPPTDAEQRAALQPLIDNGTATPAQRQMWAHLTQTSHASHSLIVPPTGGGQIPTVTPQQAAKLPRGTQFRTTDGRVLVKQ